MNTSTHDPAFDTHALQLLGEICAAQDYPTGSLYIVATPIGNRADISLRAWHTLRLADTIACEDTRHSKALLQLYGIHKSPQQWLALHQHNEMEAAQSLLGLLGQGQRVAYISDAGTPAISDPGARLVRIVQEAHYRTLPIPGPSSATAILSVSGAQAIQHLSHTDSSRYAGYLFQGFLPNVQKERLACLAVLAQASCPVVLFEAPHRISSLALALAPLGERSLTVGRELTKQFEEVITLACADFADWLSAHPHRLKGEFCLVLHPSPAPQPSQAPSISPEAQRVLRIMLDAGLGSKQASALTSKICAESKNQLYAWAIAHQDNYQK